MFTEKECQSDIQQSTQPVPSCVNIDLICIVDESLISRLDNGVLITGFWHGDLFDLLMKTVDHLVVFVSALEFI